MDLIHEPAYLTVVNLSIWQLQVQISKLENLFPQSQALKRSKKVKVIVILRRYLTF